MREPPFKPLVIGAPRSGFALLASVVIHFVPFAPSKINLRQGILNTLMRRAGSHIADEIVHGFAQAGITGDLLYNPNFRYVVGGPKWLSHERPGYACFRKYIGVRGMGDFTLVTSHPREVLDIDEIVHSHNDPGWWPDHPGYADYTRFASCRHPVGVLNSSVFSLNALASEYIQKFVPPEKDNDQIRQDLALYKFTDLDFFEGLVRFLSGYLKEFVEHRHRYILMRWEDLITEPVPTILRLSRSAGIDLSEEYAKEVWRKLDHINLTQAHKHNYRVGKGIVGDWKNWVTNQHLEMIKAHGIEPYMRELGYGTIEYLDEKQYTPFQQQVSGFLAKGEIFRDFEDMDLFTFAFNKSNLISDRFPFRRHEWREWTQIERSIFTDEVLEKRIWDIAEAACGRINGLLETFLSLSWKTPEEAHANLAKLQSGLTWPGGGNDLLDRAFAEARQEVTRHLSGQSASAPSGEPPRLVSSERGYNVVAYRGLFFGLPQSLGELHLDRDDVSQLPGVHVENSLEAVMNKIKRRFF